MMSPYWIKLEGCRLAIVPRPRGNDWLADDLRMLRCSGIDVLVSALTRDEKEELGLAAEMHACEQEGLAFVSVPIQDRSTPASATEFVQHVDRLVQFLEKEKTVAIHCRAGIGRSSLIAAALLARLGHSVESAFSAITQARGCPVPDTPQQREWLERTVKNL